MRFAWLKKNAAKDFKIQQNVLNGLLRFVYNLIWWIPVLAFMQIIDFGLGFIAFAIITFVRLGANWYRVNYLPLEKDDSFPFRS